MALGKQIRFHRERLGLTLEQLSDLSGVELGTISALELRDSKRTQYAGPLATALGLTIEQLADERYELTAVVAPDASHAAAGKTAKWPFKRISIEQIASLPAGMLEDIEDYVEMKISKAAQNKSRPNKRAA